MTAEDNYEGALYLVKEIGSCPDTDVSERLDLLLGLRDEIDNIMEELEGEL